MAKYKIPSPDKIQLVYDWKKIKDYPIQYIYDLIDTNRREKFFFDEENNRLKLERVKFFKYGKNHTCIRCGVEGTFFSLRQDKGGNFHVDLYGYMVDGKEVLINRDHIIPKSRGGVDHYTNMQVLCMPCNSKKGNCTEEELIEIEHNYVEAESK